MCEAIPSSNETKIFVKANGNLYSLRNEGTLFECQVFKHSKKNSLFSMKVLNFRICEEFMLLFKSPRHGLFSKLKNYLSKKGGLQNAKVAAFKFEYFVKFKKPKDFSNLFSFEICSSAEKRKFFVRTENELFQIYIYLKRRLNLSGFAANFQFIRQIGAGYSSKVFLAKSNQDHAEYAAKSVLKTSLLQKTMGLEALQNEIEILRLIDHPNLIKLDGVFECENSYFLIFELCRGGSLRNFLLETGVLPENLASYIMRCVLEGVKYLHINNIMHRDIKLENILLRSPNLFEPNQIVLADFGLATKNNVPQYLHGRCGTPGYVAPEVYQFSDPDDHYDLKSDLFGVGVSLFEMMTGSVPYPGKRSIQTENKKQMFDFSRMSNLSKNAQHLIRNLICSKEGRLDIFQTLNHPFFKIHHSGNEDSCEEPLSAERHTCMLQRNILGFNTRTLSLSEKNLLSLEKYFSPLQNVESIQPEKKPKAISSNGNLLHPKEKEALIHYELRNDETKEKMQIISTFN